LSRTVAVCFLAVVLIFSGAGAARASGAVMVMKNIYPSADTYCRSDEPDVSRDGSVASMIVRADEDGWRARSFIRFDLDGVPRGADVDSARLYIYSLKSANASRTHDLYRMLVNWAEGGCTWNTAAAAGACAGTSSAAVQIPTVASGYRDWGEVTADVQGWLDGTFDNYGWCIRDRSEDATGSYDYFEIYYRTRESGDRPYISINYTAPWNSYGDSARTAGEESFDSSAKNVVYMEGTGFTPGTYKVGYYDGDGALRGTETAVVSGDGVLDSLYELSADQTAGAGTWHALVFFNPANPGAAPGAPDTLASAQTSAYITAEDTFSVTAAAIPEFGQVISALVVTGLCGAVYLFFRRKRLVGA